MFTTAIYSQGLIENPLIKFLHNLNGADGGSPLTTDETGNHIFTEIGGTTDLELSTTNPIFGSTSLIDTGGTTGTLSMLSSTDFDVSGDVEFCLEGFIVVSTFVNNNHTTLRIDEGVQFEISIGDGDTDDYEWRLGMYEGLAGLTASSQVFIQSTISHAESTIPHHIAIIRKGDIIYLCADGIEQCRIALVGPNLVARPTVPRIKVQASDSAGSVTKMDSIRFTKGSSVYDPTSTFPPPNSALTLQLP